MEQDQRSNHRELRRLLTLILGKSQNTSQINRQQGHHFSLYYLPYGCAVLDFPTQLLVFSWISCVVLFVFHDKAKRTQVGNLLYV